MSRLVLLFLIAAALGAPTAIPAVLRSNPATTVLNLGDVARVSSAPVGCIASMRDHVRVLDCRKIGPHEGTYGAILSGRGVVVVRFENERVARVVFSARHRSLTTKTCQRAANQ